MTAAVAPDGANRGATLLWAAAALTALATHASVAAWALREPPTLPAEDSAPAAVMIDLAPAPVAPEVVEEEIAPDLIDAPEIVEAPPTPPEPPRPDALAPSPPVVPTPVAAAQPESHAAPPVVAPPVVEPPVVEPPAEVAVARPIPRPENLPVPKRQPPEPQRVERQPAPKQPPDAPSQASRRAQVQAQAAQKVAAPQNSRGSAGAVSPAKWQSKLMAHLERRKRYPSAARSRRAEGVVHVRFVIDTGGAVLSAQLARSSGHADLDAEVLALIRRASPVPAPPPGAPREIVAPVEFKVR